MLLVCPATLWSEHRRSPKTPINPIKPTKKCEQSPKSSSIAPPHVPTLSVPWRASAATIRASAGTTSAIIMSSIPMAASTQAVPSRRSVPIAQVTTPKALASLMSAASMPTDIQPTPAPKPSASPSSSSSAILWKNTLYPLSTATTSSPTEPAPVSTSSNGEGRTNFNR